MCLFDSNFEEQIIKICKQAITDNIVLTSKHTDLSSGKPTGIACFYIDGKQQAEHIKVLEFFLANNLIPRNKNGNYRNISFKFDEQTTDKQYGTEFKAKISLADFVDVKTGEFLDGK
ncbi:MAG: hypothetical protein ACK5HR_07230 [Mycoplasmatales bacterium]